MPRAKSKKEKDDLDEELEGEEEETEEAEEESEESDEEEEESDEEEESEESEEEEEESEDETPVKKVKAKTTGKKLAKSKAKLGYGIVLRNGKPIKVAVVSVRGEVARVKKPGMEDSTALKVPSSTVRKHDDAAFEKLSNKWDKISELHDAQIAAHSKLEMFKAKAARKRRVDPMNDW